MITAFFFIWQKSELAETWRYEMAEKWIWQIRERLFFGMVNINERKMRWIESPNVRVIGDFWDLAIWKVSKLSSQKIKNNKKKLIWLFHVQLDFQPVACVFQIATHKRLQVGVLDHVETDVPAERLRFPREFASEVVG